MKFESYLRNKIKILKQQKEDALRKEDFYKCIFYDGALFNTEMTLYELIHQHPQQCDGADGEQDTTQHHGRIGPFEINHHKPTDSAG